MMFPLGFISQGGGGGAGGGGIELISTTVVSVAAASVTFSSIPQTYKHLQVRVAARTASAGNAFGYLLLNGDGSAANYTLHYLQGNGSSVASAGFATGSFAGAAITRVTGTDSATGSFGVSVTDILDYATTTKNKTVRSFTGYLGASNLVALNSSAWINTSAVTSMTISTQDIPLFAIGSRFSLYGVKG